MRGNRNGAVKEKGAEDEGWRGGRHLSKSTLLRNCAGGRPDGGQGDFAGRTEAPNSDGKRPGRETRRKARCVGELWTGQR